MDQSYGTHNALVPYPTMHHSENVHISALNVHYGIWDSSIMKFVNYKNSFEMNSLLQISARGFQPSKLWAHTKLGLTY